MTITTNPARNEYTSTAGQTVFNYTFKIYTNADLNVYVTPAGQDANDSTDITTAYTVDTGTIGDDAGGFITLDSPLSAGDKVTIVSDIPTDRTTDYQVNGDFIPDTVNNDFDRTVSLVKQVENLASRTVQFQESQQSASNITLPAPSPGEILVWNPGGTGFDNSDGTDIQGINQAVIDAEAARDAAQLAESGAQTSESNSASSATLSQAWAESATEPGGAGTKSSKTWASESESSAGDSAASATQAALNAAQAVRQPLTAHGSMFEPAAQDDFTTPATVANEFTVDAGQYRVNGTLIDLPATTVTLSAAPATSSLLSRKDLVYLQEDGTVVAFEGTDDNPTMTDAGFSAVSGEVGLWANGGVYAIPINQNQRLNSGLYHPAFNEWGCAKASDGNFWYNTTDSILSTADCFVGQTGGSIASGVSGRPDGKFYDAIYLSDITDLRLQAIAPSATQLEPNYWQNKAVANTLRHFVTEGIPVTVVKERGVVELLSNRNATNTIFTIGDAVNGVALGDFFIIINQDNEVRSYGHVSSIDSGNKRVGLVSTFSGGINGDTTGVWNRTNGDIYTILKVEYTTATGADNTWTDVIGDPANYPRQWTGVIDHDSTETSATLKTGETVEAIAGNFGNGTAGNIYLYVNVDGSGIDLSAQNYGTSTVNWLDLGPKAEFLANATGFEGFPLLYGENGEDLIPDGVIDTWKLKRKMVAEYDSLFGDDKGVSYSSFSPIIDSVANEFSIGTPKIDRVYQVVYTTPAHIFSDDANSEVLGGKLSDVQVIQHYNATSGAPIWVSDLIDKVSIGTAQPTFSNVTLTKQGVNPSSSGPILASFLVTEHTPFTLNGFDSPTVKALSYLHDIGDGLSFFSAFKEAIYDTTWGDDNTFTVTDNTSTDTDDNANTILVGTKSTKLPLVNQE